MSNKHPSIHASPNLYLLLVFLVGCDFSQKPELQHPVYPASHDDVASVVASYDAIVAALSRVEVVMYDTDGGADIRLGPVVIDDADTLDKVRRILKDSSRNSANESPFKQSLEYEDAFLTLVAEQPTYKTLRCRLLRESYMYVPDSEIAEIIVAKEAYSSLLAIAREKVIEDNMISLRNGRLAE